jgi:hypothetical protein
MYNQVELKLSFSDRYRSYEDGEEAEVGIEFESVSKMRNFINNGQRVFKVLMNDTYGRTYRSMYTVFKVIKIHKIKHKKIEATIQKMNLRDYNLDTILEAI